MVEQGWDPELLIPRPGLCLSPRCLYFPNHTVLCPLGHLLQLKAPQPSSPGGISGHGKAPHSLLCQATLWTSCRTRPLVLASSLALLLDQGFLAPRAATVHSAPGTLDSSKHASGQAGSLSCLCAASAHPHPHPPLCLVHPH